MSESLSDETASSQRLFVPPSVLQYLEEMQRQDKSLEDQKNLKARISRIAECVCDEAKARLDQGAHPSALFHANSFCAYVVSLDLRRSTEMMLFAKTSDCFAAFVWNLCKELGKIIKKHFGVIEKFTGDGLLAYFRTDFAGAHAGYRAVKACREAVDKFTQHYAQSRDYFTCLLADFGLSAGIDFGEVQLRLVEGAPSILGRPVVFACRLSSGPTGAVLVNQTAYDHLQESCPGGICFEDALLEIKQLGMISCYRVKKQDTAFQLKNPDWYEGTPLAND